MSSFNVKKCNFTKNNNRKQANQSDGVNILICLLTVTGVSIFCLCKYAWVFFLKTLKFYFILDYIFLHSVLKKTFVCVPVFFYDMKVSFDK